jgi:effector-binding domain-containing protein
MAIEEASYLVLEQDGKFEIRDYPAHVIAETLVQGGLEQAGKKAFQKLFRYISGDNRSRAKLAMTAPVGQRPAQGNWAVSFMMPASQSLETLPDPEDLKVVLRQVPARRMAAVRYSGFWDEKGYLRYKNELEAWIQVKGLAVAGEPVWARYNSPYTPWFLRRNEILIPVADQP